MAKAKSTAGKPAKSVSLFKVLVLTVSLLVAIGVLLLALLAAGLAFVIAGVLFFRWRRARKTRAAARAEVRENRAAAREKVKEKTKARRSRRGKREAPVAAATDVAAAAVNDPIVRVPVVEAVAA